MISCLDEYRPKRVAEKNCSRDITVTSPIGLNLIYEQTVKMKAVVLRNQGPFYSRACPSQK